MTRFARASPNASIIHLRFALSPMLVPRSIATTANSTNRGGRRLGGMLYMRFSFSAPLSVEAPLAHPAGSERVRERGSSGHGHDSRPDRRTGASFRRAIARIFLRIRDIDRRRLDVLVAQVQLQLPDVHAQRQQMRRVAVPKRVDRRPLAYPGSDYGVMEGLLFSAALR